MTHHIIHILPGLSAFWVRHTVPLALTRLLAPSSSPSSLMHPPSLPSNLHPLPFSLPLHYPLTCTLLSFSLPLYPLTCTLCPSLSLSTLIFAPSLSSSSLLSTLSLHPPPSSLPPCHLIFTLSLLIFSPSLPSYLHPLSPAPPFCQPSRFTLLLPLSLTALLFLLLPSLSLPSFLHPIFLVSPSLFLPSSHMYPPPSSLLPLP